MSDESTCRIIHKTITRDPTRFLRCEEDDPPISEHSMKNHMNIHEKSHEIHQKSLKKSH